jgi:uncharacterized membrane protein (DUF106 family)
MRHCVRLTLSSFNPRMTLLLLGVLLGFVASVIANLVTPFMKPLWMKLVSLQRQGYQAQVRQQIKVLQTQLDRLNARRAGPEKDLYLELFQWSLGSFSAFVGGIACALIATVGSTSDRARGFLLNAAMGLLIVAVVVSLVMLNYSRELSSTGMLKKAAKLEADLAKLTAKLTVT